MVETSDIDSTTYAIDGLTTATGLLGQMAEDLTQNFRNAAKEGGDFSNDFRKNLNTAMRDALIEGDSLSDSLRNLARTMAQQSLDRALTPAINAASNGVVGFIEGLLPFANGGVIEGGNVRAFANGGVVSGATNFPMANGLGLMGEAGPEAIIPLTRGADGKLGVASTGGQSSTVNVTFNIQTNDAQSFQKSQAQIGAQMRRVIAQSSRGNAS